MNVNKLFNHWTFPNFKKFSIMKTSKLNAFKKAYNIKKISNHQQQKVNGGTGVTSTIPVIGLVSGAIAGDVVE